jgi:thioredoxin 1
MAAVELTLDNFESTIAENETVIVDFWSDCCGPCKMFAPTFEQASEDHPDIVFGKVDTEAQQALAGSFGIMSIPTLMVFRDNVILFNQAGALPGPVFNDLIGQVKDLDMDDVRRQIAEQEANGHSHE